jgi:2'-5' RNA ligase
VAESTDYSVTAESAILVALPELHEFTERWRSACEVAGDPPRPLSEVVPPHITVLVPWVPDPKAPRAVAALREVAATSSPFEISFDSVAVWDDLVLFEPESDRLDGLLSEVWEKFPDHPPYDGQFETVHPHVTVSTQGGEAVGAEVRDALAQRGDFTVRVGELSTWQRGSDGIWQQLDTFPLG